jgi:hypothetical protein
VRASIFGFIPDIADQLADDIPRSGQHFDIDGNRSRGAAIALIGYYLAQEIIDWMPPALSGSP